VGNKTSAEASVRSSALPVVPAIIRGQIVTDNLVQFTGRGDSLTFLTPDPAVLVKDLPLASPSHLRDLHDLEFEEILDYLEELGNLLDIDKSPYMQWARELTYSTSHLTKPLIDNAFRKVPQFFRRERVREMAEKTVGLKYLNGWTDITLANGSVVGVRAFGARGVHIIPGNGPSPAVKSIIQSAFTRSDCIIKTPSNGPFMAAAVGQVMCEFAPEHPVTKHLAVCYWRGGDVDVEQRIYQPHKVEKIVAYGGFASVKHVTRYIQPGLELISLDPKNSASVLDLAALSDESSMREAALRLAVDMGVSNQQPCSSARVAYVVTHKDPHAEALMTRLARFTYEELIGLPSGLSTTPKSYDGELRSHVQSLRLQEDFYTVVGGEADEGCVIVSHLPDPVDFKHLLADRTLNLVPADSVADVILNFDSYTQTVGVFPESLKDQLLDIAPFYGVQRFVSLGYSGEHTGCTPHDGLEMERRMCKWVINQKIEPVPLAYAASRDGAASDSTAEVVPSSLRAVHAH